MSTVQSAKLVAADVPQAFLDQLNGLDWTAATTTDLADARAHMQEGIRKYKIPLKADQPGYVAVSAGESKRVRADVPQEIIDLYNLVAWGLITPFNRTLMLKGLKWVIANHVTKRVPVR